MDITVSYYYYRLGSKVIMREWFYLHTHSLIHQELWHASEKTFFWNMWWETKVHEEIDSCLSLHKYQRGLKVITWYFTRHDDRDWTCMLWKLLLLRSILHKQVTITFMKAEPVFITEHNRASLEISKWLSSNITGNMYNSGVVVWF